MGFSEPRFADGFVGREALEGLEAPPEVISGDEVGEVLPKLIVVFVVVALDRRVLDRSVHSFDLTIGPGMPRLCWPMFHIQFGAGELEGMAKEALVLRLHLLEIFGHPAITGGIGEVRAIVGEHCVNLIRHGGGTGSR